MRIQSPYANERIPWRKGNLHAHTTMSDGERTPQELIYAYAKGGYDFLAISDHDMITGPSAFDARGMTLIPCNEVTVNGPHILHVDATAAVSPGRDRQHVLDGIGADSGFAVVAHPNWERHFNHCPQDCLERWNGYIGIEIYNGLVRRHDGNPLATDKWDMLLSQGRRVWGFANDDAHQVGDEGIAWNMVQSEKKDAASIVDAMGAGRFYASTGVVIDSIQVEGNVIRVTTRNAERVAVSTEYARRVTSVDAAEIAFAVPRDFPRRYVRVECYGEGESMAWTQPFFVEA